MPDDNDTERDDDNARADDARADDAIPEPEPEPAPASAVEGGRLHSADEERDEIARGDAERRATLDAEYADLQARLAALANEMQIAEGEAHAQNEAEAPARDEHEQRAFEAEARVLAEVAGNLTRLRAELQQRVEHRDEIEAEEKARQDTPLCLEPMIVGCNLATTTFPAGETMPHFEFRSMPCPFGKSRPDQDCRLCQEVKYTPLGSHLPRHHRRYHRHGLIFPLRTAEEAEKVAQMLDVLGVRSLRHVDSEIDALQRAIAQLEAQASDALARDLERRQRGPMRFAQATVTPVPPQE